MSGTSFGQRLDLKPLGPIAAPWRVPVCPKCRFPDYRQGDEENYMPDELRDLKKYVVAEEFKSISPKDSSHYLIARVYEHQRKPPATIAWMYLQASWQVEQDPPREKAYLEKCLAFLDKHLAANPKASETLQTNSFLRGEILRRLGKFDEGNAHFEMIKSQADFEKDPFSELIAREQRLIAAKDATAQ